MRKWEDQITLNSSVEPSFTVLAPAKDHLATDSRTESWSALDYAAALEKDTYALPVTEDREGYYGPDHFSYWASGFQDANMLLDAAQQHGTHVRSFLDMGCASGRVIRHFGVQRPEIETFGCDINRLHVEWCNTYLPPACKVFQNHSIPTLPLPDNSIDLISAFSVFTHIESMETAWLMELMRVMRPGGLAWLTVHSEHTLAEMDETWPLWKPIMDHPLSSELLDDRRQFKGDRMVMRWLDDASYSSNVFYKQEYIEKVWGRLINIAEFRRRCPSYQDVVLVKKL